MTTTMTDLQTGRTFVFNEALPGRDAYEEALALGFDGTRAEWIASLRGLDFDPASPTWENDRTYPPRAAVIHDNSFWFARATNQMVEPGTDDAVWMKLVHGEDAATLSGAMTALAEIRDTADLLANAPEDQDLGDGKFSANHFSIKAAQDRFLANEARAGAEGALAEAIINSALIPAVLANSATLAAVLGQTDRRVEDLEEGQGDGAVLRGLVIELASVLGQISSQINGGRATFIGGNLADPALRIGSVGIYSSATDTLSIAISGTEVARFTAAGLTVFGTITES